MEELKRDFLVLLELSEKINYLRQREMDIRVDAFDTAEGRDNFSRYMRKAGATRIECCEAIFDYQKKFVNLKLAFNRSPKVLKLHTWNHDLGQYDNELLIIQDTADLVMREESSSHILRQRTAL